MRYRASAALDMRADSDCILNRHVRLAGLHLQRFFRRVLELLVGRQHDRRRTHVLMHGVDAGRLSPFSIAFSARSRRCRAMMMPLSVETRFSLVRSTIGPMLSCSEASCMAMPSTPL